MKKEKFLIIIAKKNIQDEIIFAKLKKS